MAERTSPPVHAVTMSEPSAVRPNPWRWMILFSRFLSSFMTLGNFKSMGVFLPHFVDDFATDTATAGLVASAALGFGMLTAGPFVGALLKVWDARKLSIVGGVLVATTTIAASFSSSVAQLGVWFALSSVGLMFAGVPPIQSLMDYFPDDFAFANGVSLAGGTIGMMVLPPVMEWLVSLYGWRNALGLMGALCFHFLVGGVLLRPLEKTHVTSQYSPVPNRANGEKTTSASMANGQLFDKTRDSERLRSLSVFWTSLEILGEHFDTKLLAEPSFIAYQVVLVLEGMAYIMWHLYLIPQGTEKGFGDARSAVLATFGGIGALIGRLGHGTLVDRGVIKGWTIFVLSCLVFALFNMLVPFVESSYMAMAAIATVTGIGIGIFYPMTFVLMREITGDRHMSAFGWLYLTQGAGQLLGGFCGGWIRDLSGEYVFVFMTLGAVAVTMATVLALMRLSLYCCETKD